MTPFEAPLVPPWVGDVVFAAALLLFVWFLHLAQVLRLHERDTWWASNGRDVVNAAAVVTLLGAISLQGISLPLALLFAATLTLALTVLHDALQRRVRHPAWIVLGAAVVLGTPLILAPAEVAAAAAAALERAFAPAGG